MKKKFLFLIIAIAVIGIGLFLALNKNPFTSSAKTLTVQDVQNKEKEIDEWNANDQMKERGFKNNLNELVGMYNNRPVEIVYICFGDVCPDNGGFALRYAEKISREECVTIGGKPIIGISWGEVYAGCGLNISEK